MGTTIPQRDLRNHHTQIIERVAAGESFVVTRDGVPVADVHPHVPDHRPPRFPATADLSWSVDDVRVDLALWYADIRAGDEHVTDDPTDDA